MKASGWRPYSHNHGRPEMESEMEGFMVDDGLLSVFKAESYYLFKWLIKKNTRELGTLAFHHVISSLCIWNHSSCWFIFLPQPSLLPKCSKFPIVPSTPSLHSLQCSPTLDFHKVRHFQGPLPKLCPTTSTNGFGRSSQWMPWWLVKILQCQGPCGGHGMNSKGLEIGPAAKKSPTWGWWILELANTSYGAFVAFIMTGLGL